MQNRGEMLVEHDFRRDDYAHAIAHSTSAVLVAAMPEEPTEGQVRILDQATAIARAAGLSIPYIRWHWRWVDPDRAVCTGSMKFDAERRELTGYLKIPVAPEDLIRTCLHELTHAHDFWTGRHRKLSAVDLEFRADDFAKRMFPLADHCHRGGRVGHIARDVEIAGPAPVAAPPAQPKAAPKPAPAPAASRARTGFVTTRAEGFAIPEETPEQKHRRQQRERADYIALLGTDVKKHVAILKAAIATGSHSQEVARMAVIYDYRYQFAEWNGTTIRALAARLLRDVAVLKQFAAN